MKKIIIPFIILLAIFSSIDIYASKCSENKNFIDVTANGEVSAVPDQATVTITIEQEGSHVSNLKSKSEELLKKFNLLASDLKVNSEKINSSNLNLSPQYNWNKGKKVFNGYKLSKAITITKEDINKSYELITGSIAIGIHNISNIQLTSSKKKELKNEALQEASKNAIAKAKLLAESFNVKIAGIKYISDSTTTSNSARFWGKSESYSLAGSNDSKPDIKVGTINISSTVKATFYITNK